MALPLRVEPIEIDERRRARVNALPGQRPMAPVVRLTVIQGGRAGELERRPSRPDARTYRRRRMVVFVVLMAVTLAVLAGMGALGSATRIVLAERAAAPSADVDTPTTLRGQPLVAGGTYIAQRGDTLWTIARALQPAGDLTEVLRRLIRLNGGSSLAVGQRVLLPS